MFWEATNKLSGVAYRPRFGGDSQARTPQLVWDQLERPSWAGTSWRGLAG